LSKEKQVEISYGLTLCIGVERYRPPITSRTFRSKADYVPTSTEHRHQG
jgi:hypothetical protein